jgi:glycosyltransferase involved in cell wall biosynthesis
MFICDPVCVLPFGHNAPAMTYFRAFFEPAFDRIECCVGQGYRPKAASEQGFRPCFRYLYGDVMPLETDTPEPALDDLGGAWPNDAASRAATADYAALMTDAAMGPADLLFLPSADFHSVHGLLTALRRMPPEASPRVLLRLIGVMENAGHVVVEPLRHVVAAVVAAREAGHRVLLAAETPAYASHLASTFDLDVAMLPYPLLGDILPPPEGDRFVVASVGSARFDKGYLDLLPIIQEVRRRDDGIPVEFRIQVLPDSQIGHQQTYTNQLYAMPGVRLLPAVLDADEMRDLYAGCHAVLLPYEHGIYQLRGSAVLMEAIGHARYAIGRDRLGFSSQIQYYRNGAVCGSVAEFASAIQEAASRPAAMLRRQLALARERYRDDTAAAYRMWMESCFA